MVQKPSTKAGFRPPIPQSRYLYEQCAEIAHLDGLLGDAHTHTRLRQISFRITRLGNLVSSFQIEGIDIDRARGASALAGKKSGSPFEDDIKRFGALYEELHEAERTPSLTPDMIREWHARLFTKDSLDQGDTGAWKSDKNGVWDNTKGTWVFEATPKDDTIAEVKALLDWHEAEAYKLPAAMAAAIFFAEFESIHPFPDGNGRLGRLLNLWSLKRNGLKNAFLAPIDERFKRSQERYYAALSTTNTGQAYSDYCGYYLAELREAYGRAQHLGRLDEIFRELSRENARRVFSWILASSADDWFKRGSYPNEEGLSDSTLTKILGELAELGLLEAEGDRKARRYRLDWNAVLERVPAATPER
jgi:Fic family protein